MRAITTNLSKGWLWPYFLLDADDCIDDLQASLAGGVAPIELRQLVAIPVVRLRRAARPE